MHSGHTALLQNLAVLVLGMKEKGKPTLCELPPQPRSHEGTLDTSSDPKTTLRGGYCYNLLWRGKPELYKVKQFVPHCIVISDTPGFESCLSNVKAHAPSIKP